MPTARACPLERVVGRRVHHDKIHAEDCAECETQEGKIDQFEREHPGSKAISTTRSAPAHDGDRRQVPGAPDARAPQPDPDPAARTRRGGILTGAKRMKTLRLASPSSWPPPAWRRPPVRRRRCRRASSTCATSTRRSARTCATPPPYNFTGRRVPGYRAAECVLTRQAAAALSGSRRRCGPGLLAQGLRLLPAGAGGPGVHGAGRPIRRGAR